MNQLRLALAVVLGAVVLGPFATPASAAGPYPPPSKGTGHVEPSRIKVGDCAVFSGDGFAPATVVTVTDNGAPAGTARGSANGTFSIRLCYASDAKRGRHNLAGTGNGSNGDPLTVHAMLIVEGVRQSAGNPNTADGGAPNGQDGGAPNTADGGAPSDPTVVQPPGGGIAEPPAVVGGDSGTAIPASVANSGTRLLILGATGLGFAFLASLLLLLIARRRRRREEDDPLVDAAPALA